MTFAEAIVKMAELLKFSEDTDNAHQWCLNNSAIETLANDMVEHVQELADIASLYRQAGDSVELDAKYDALMRSKL